jgi:hypothetical protein
MLGNYDGMFRRGYSEFIGGGGSSGDDDNYWRTPMYQSAASDNDYQTPREFSDNDSRPVRAGVTASVSASSEAKQQRGTDRRSQAQSSKRDPEDKQHKGDYQDDAFYYNDDHLLMSANVTQEQVEETFSFARHGRCENMESLLSQGVPVDVRDGHGNTLLAISCQNGNKKIAKCLLRRGANINSRNHKGNTPLHFCFHCK